MSLFIPLSLQIGRHTRSNIIFLAIPIRDLVSLLQLSSADFQRSEIFEIFDHLHCSSSIGLCFPNVQKLGGFTFNFSSLAFTMLLTVPKNLSASSCDPAQSAMSSACLIFEPNFNLS